MNKWVFGIFFVFLVAGSVSGKTVFERSFSEMGYNGLEVKGVQERQCSEIKFVFPSNVNAFEAGNYPLASLKLKLLPIKGKNFAVSAELNNKGIGEFKTPDFYCEGEFCWLRVSLPKELLKEEENSLEICLSNTVDVVESLLLRDSSIGVYNTVDFLDEDSFWVEADRSKIVLGEKINIKLIIHNKGSAAGFVEMKYARKLAEDKDAFVVVDGNTYFKDFVSAGEKIEIDYVIKPRVVGPISFPPAILYYSNEFGEPQQKFAEMITIEVKEPEVNVSAFVVKGAEVEKVGDTVNLQLAVKNNGKNPLYNIGLDLKMPEGLAIYGAKGNTIESLEAGATDYLDFSVGASKAGSYKISCTLTFFDLNASESSCSQSTLVFEEPQIPIEVFAGFALLLVAVIVYLYIQKTG